MTQGSSTAAPPEGAVKASARSWLGLAVLAVPCLLYAMDLTVLNLAVPEISRQLQPSAAQLLWIVDIYGFMVAGLLILMGTLGDRIGRRRLLMLGAAAFAATSALAAFSTSPEMLIAGRALQGAAGATLAPSTLALIRNMFADEDERRLAIGIWVASFSTGAALGPVLGGIVLEHFWWGAVLLVNVPAMLVLLVAAPVLLPEYRDCKAGQLDLVSAAQSLLAVLPVVYGVKRIAEGGPVAWSLAVIAAGLVFGALFVRRQRRLADPMIDLALFRAPRLAAALSINIIGLFTVMATFLFIAQHLQAVLGLGPLEAGLWTAPSGLVFALGSIATPILVRRVDSARVLTAGFLVAAAGYLLLVRLYASPDLATLVAGMVVLCIGLAPVGTITTDIVLAAAPPERAGAASAISETSFELGAALGLAVLGSAFAAVYRSSFDTAGLEGVGHSALAIARGSIGGAMEAARGLSGRTGGELLASAYKAFATAFASTALISVAASLLAAVLAHRLLRARSAP